MAGGKDNLVWRPQRENGANWAMLLFLPAVWMIPCTLFIVVIAGATGLIVTPPGWAVAPVMALFVAFSVDRMIRKHREMRARVVLGYVENAMRLNLPLPAFLAAAEESERGRTRLHLQRLRMCLTSGFAVHAALVEALPEMPEEISRTLAAAEPLGQMERALARVLKRKRPGRQVEVEERASFYRFYPIGLTLMILLVATFLMLFVMPKVREIVKDYRIPTPWTTNVMLQVSSLLTEHAWILLVAALLALAIYWPMSLYLHRIILPGWRLPAVGGVLELVKWWIPGLRGIERDQSMAQTAEFLEEALRAGVPLTRALERSLLLPTNAYLRKRLRRWMDDLEAGQPAGEAARNAGLPELLAGLLAPGQDDAALADMFGFLARYYRQRFSRGLVLLRAALEPAVVILFGVLVFGVALSVLQPIIAIMQHEMSFYPGYL